jgi:hypothetical protein
MYHTTKVSAGHYCHGRKRAILRRISTMVFMHLWAITLGWITSWGVHLTHTKPESNPAVFKEFIDLEAVQSPLGIQNLTKLVAMVDVWQEPGSR